MTGKGSSREPASANGSATTASVTKKTSPSSSGCRIAGIGASAGGLDSFSRLLSALPEHVGLALVLAQHLDPTHESHLAQILGHSSKMPVLEVTDGMRIEHDHVYVMPSGSGLVVSGGLLHLRPLRAKGDSHRIDALFESLAQECLAGSVGMILSGTGEDGLRGLAAIADAGGLAFAQDPETAEYRGMPQAAIDGGVVEAALTPEELAEVLVRIGTDEYVPRSKRGESGTVQLDEADLDRIMNIVHESTGLDLSGYRRASLSRRISRRMLLADVTSTADYVARLQADPSEISALYRDILVNVTEFFRDPEVLESLAGEVLPEILRALPAEDEIRVWVPGCSTGQEAYSIAMLLLEYADETRPLPTAHVFGSDVNASDIEVARTGVYPPSIEHEVSPDRLGRFFVPVPGGYRVNQVVRDMCVFAVHDVIQDPPFSKLDLVSFRNVLIYMERPLQRRVFQVLHYALKPGGFLLLGSAEAADMDSGLFSVADKKHHIYVRSPGPSILPTLSSSRFRHEPSRGPDTPGDDAPRMDAAASEIEELRTINEEFQTAQEELQSTNEELTTLNDELRNRNAALVTLTDDLNNVLEGAEIPLLILDKELHIRRFTPQSARGDQYRAHRRRPRGHRLPAEGPRARLRCRGPARPAIGTPLAKRGRGRAGALVLDADPPVPDGIRRDRRRGRSVLRRRRPQEDGRGRPRECGDRARSTRTCGRSDRDGSRCAPRVGRGLARRGGQPVLLPDLPPITR